MAQVFDNNSPKWSWTTKLVVGLSVVAALAFLVFRFRQYLGPLILAAIITYLSYPVARFLQKRAHLSWRLSVTIFYLLLIVTILGLLTWGGLTLLQQGQNLVTFIQESVLKTLPDVVSNLLTQKFVIGKYIILDFTKLTTLQDINNQVLSTIRPVVGQVGTILTTVATSAATFLGWVAFIILISYFITAEAGGDSQSTFLHEVPGFTYDYERFIIHLRSIWNIFLRGQLFLFLMAVIIYSIVLSIFGVRFALGIALLAGFGRFLPYIGPFIAWTTLGLVAIFQGHTIFNLTPLAYVILVIGTAMLTDSIFDNFVSPKVMGSSLRVHPAAVLVTALIAANIIGLVGVVVAAPVLATLKLFGRYTIRKMFDLDPWTGMETEREGSVGGFLPPSLIPTWNRLRNRLRVPSNLTAIVLRRKSKEIPKAEEKS